MVSLAGDHNTSANANLGSSLIYRHSSGKPDAVGRKHGLSHRSSWYRVESLPRSVTRRLDL